MNVHISNFVFSLCSCHSKTMFSKSLDICDANPKFNKEERYTTPTICSSPIPHCYSLKMQYLPFSLGIYLLALFRFPVEGREKKIAVFCIITVCRLDLAHQSSDALFCARGKGRQRSCIFNSCMEENIATGTPLHKKCNQYKHLLQHSC